MLSLSDEVIGSRALLNISGTNIAVENYNNIRERIDYFISKDVRNIVFDLTRVEIVDSGLVNLVQSTNRRLRDVGGAAELIYEGKNGKDVFEMTGLYKVLSAYKTRKEFDEKRKHHPVK